MFGVGLTDFCSSPAFTLQEPGQSCGFPGRKLKHTTSGRHHPVSRSLICSFSLCPLQKCGRRGHRKSGGRQKCTPVSLSPYLLLPSICRAGRFSVLFPSFVKNQVALSTTAEEGIHPRLRRVNTCNYPEGREWKRGGLGVWDYHMQTDKVRMDKQ